MTISELRELVGNAVAERAKECAVLQTENGPVYLMPADLFPGVAPDGMVRIDLSHHLSME